MWTVVVEKEPRKFLRRIPVADAMRIQAALDRLAEDPFVGDIRKLAGRDYRLRVGSYRAFLELDFDSPIARVTRIARRTSTTY